VFGVYDCTNDQMLTHSYKRKTSRQFLYFIRRVERKYYYNTTHIFLILDNASIHKSNMVKETLTRYHPRIHLVFLPTRTPELNLIEVRWLWLHRQAINNSVFNDEQDIGKAVSNWTHYYNKIHRFKASTTSLQMNVSRHLHGS
jgi:transposase